MRSLFPQYSAMQSWISVGRVENVAVAIIFLFFLSFFWGGVEGGGLVLKRD